MCLRYSFFLSFFFSFLCVSLCVHVDKNNANFILERNRKMRVCVCVCMYDNKEIK